MNALRPVPPALLTRISIPPKRSTVRALLEAASYAYEGEAGFDDYFVKACS